LVITGLVGLRPRADQIVEVSPLIPEDIWEWFCLDGVKYHGRNLTILWDANGTRYGRGRGLSILVDGGAVGHNEKLQKLTAKLP